MKQIDEKDNKMTESSGIADDVGELTLMTDQNRARFRSLGRCDQSIAEIFCEFAVLTALLESDDATIDVEARAGLQAAADRALLGLAAIPAADVQDLWTKIIASEAGGPRNPARGLMATMLEAAIDADMDRLKPGTDLTRPRSHSRRGPTRQPNALGGVGEYRPSGVERACFLPGDRTGVIKFYRPRNKCRWSRLPSGLPECGSLGADRTEPGPGTRIEQTYSAESTLMPTRGG